MKKKLSSQFFDLDIENPIGRGTLAKIDPPCRGFIPVAFLTSGFVHPNVMYSMEIDAKVRRLVVGATLVNAG